MIIEDFTALRRDIYEQAQRDGRRRTMIARVIERSWQLMHENNARILGAKPPWWNVLDRADWRWRSKHPAYRTPHIAHVWDACDELDVDVDVFNQINDVFRNSKYHREYGLALPDQG